VAVGGVPRRRRRNVRRLALDPEGEYLEVLVRGEVPAGLAKRANYVGGVRSTVADFTYAYWRPIGA
jgi:hypothetical protein